MDGLHRRDRLDTLLALPYCLKNTEVGNGVFLRSTINSLGRPSDHFPSRPSARIAAWPQPQSRRRAAQP